MEQKYIELTGSRTRLPILFNKKRIIYVHAGDGETVLFLNEGSKIYVKESYDDVKRMLIE